MASTLTTAPRGTFTLHARQLQHVRHASNAVAPFQAGLFKPPASVIKPWKVVAGAQEWQTSTYHYNKQTTKTLPSASTTVDKLLRDYSTMVPARGGVTSYSTAGARTAIQTRRKGAEKIYVSGTSAKDYGDRVVVTAYVFDGIEAAKEEKERRDKQRREQQDERDKKGGAAAGGAGQKRRGPPRGGAPGGGGGAAARGPPRVYGARTGAAGAARGPPRAYGAGPPRA